MEAGNHGFNFYKIEQPKIEQMVKIGPGFLSTRQKRVSPSFVNRCLYFQKSASFVVKFPLLKTLKIEELRKQTAWKFSVAELV